MKVLYLCMMMILFITCNNVTDGNAILDLLAVEGDTLIGVTSSAGIIITTDAGKNWKPYSTPQHFNEIVIDEHGVLWAIDSWGGIHEEGHSRIYFSKDFGKSWEEEFDINKFFPYEFISLPHQNISIKTFDNKIYKLTGSNLKRDWFFVDSLIQEPFKTIYSYPYKIYEQTIFKKDTIQNKWNTLIIIPEISIAFECLQSNDSLFIASGGYGGYKALFASVKNDTSVTKYAMEGTQALGIVKDSKGRKWTFGDGGIFLFEKNRLKKMY